uniref:transcriptional regulator n=1 Tax=Leucobacter chromiireducens TaxID=283877 RepID=UPI0013DE1CF8
RPPRRSRRVQRPAPAGVDPRPSEHALTARAGEDRAEGWDGAQGESGSAEQANEARLKRDRPPHWG